MDNPDLRAAVVSKVLRKYKKVVRIMRIIPFIYLALVAIVSFLSGFMSERFACIIDCTLFVSPVVSAGTLFLSGILGMCRWHKAACLLPYSSRIVSFIDTNIISLTQNEIAVVNCVIGFLLTSFMLLAFKRLLCTTSPKI